MLTEGPELRALAEEHPLQIPVTTVGSRGGGFTHAAFSNVTKREVTAVRLDGVGHYVAQEAPRRLADVLLAAWAVALPS
jgi:mono/diheme cytochrome c family protein